MSGRLWMYSDQLDDEDLAFARHSFFRYSEGIAYYRLTEKIITRIAREANAIYKIDGKTYEAEVFPATAFVGESVFCYDTDGKLVYYLEGETEVSAALIGKLSYTITAIDDKVDETLFDLSAYQLK